MNKTEIGIVVPTLGTRPEYLLQCLTSIRSAGLARIHIVKPQQVLLPPEITEDLFDEIVDDPNQGLAAAIHRGLVSFPNSIRYVNWLGDDDLLRPRSLEICLEILRNDSKTVLVYGGCEYIDKSGRSIFTNRSGTYAVPLLRFGPQLIPQPGSLFRLDSYLAIGGLNLNYRWAFDLDILIRFSRIGNIQFARSVLSSFRWHDESLSVGGRDGSVKEASLVRQSYLPMFIRPISRVWEAPLSILIKYAGRRVSKRVPD